MISVFDREREQAQWGNALRKSAREGERKIQLMTAQ